MLRFGTQLPKSHWPLSFSAPKSQRFKSQRRQDANTTKSQTLAFYKSQRFSATKMPALQRDAAWAKERLSGDLRQSVPQNGGIHLHIVESFRKLANFGDRSGTLAPAYSAKIYEQKYGPKLSILPFFSKVPEAHHSRGTTLREALLGNLPLRGLCGVVTLCL